MMFKGGGMRYCVDCKNYNGWGNCDASPDLPDIVTGVRFGCCKPVLAMRSMGCYCGEGARFFVKRIVANEPAPVDYSPCSRGVIL